MKSRIIFMVLVLVLGAFGVAHGQNITTAGLELANTFQQLNTFLLGIQLNGSNAGTVKVQAAATSASYTFTFPPTAPQPNQIIAGDISGGTKWTTPCGGFQAGGDLSGNSTSQTIVGINGIPIDTTVTPQDGWALKYKASTGKWTPQP